MEVIHARCAGLDVHKQTVVACVRVTTAGRAQHEVRTFATTAAGLRALQEWLGAVGCTHAVLESTGAYWKGHEAHLTGAGMKAACGSVGRCGAPGEGRDWNGAAELVWKMTGWP